MIKANISFYQKWIVLAAIIGINLTMGVNYSWSIFKKALVEDMLWSNLDASLPYTVYIIFYACYMTVSGRMQDKYGPRIVTLLGSILLGIGYILCSFATGLLSFLFAYSIVVAMGNSLCYSTTIPTAIKWFPPERRGTVTGIVIAATSLASFFISPYVSWLISGYDVSKTFLILGITLSIIIFTCSRFIRNPEIKTMPKDNGKNLSNINRDYVREYLWREMLKTSMFYKLWIMCMFASSPGLMIIGHITTIAQIQAKWDLGYYLVMTIAIFNTVGRLISGILFDRYGRKNVIFAAILIQSLNMVSFLHYSNLSFLVLGAAITGLCYGSSFAFFPIAIADLYGVKNAGANYGFLVTAWGMAGFIGPVIAGWSVDVTAVYTRAYIVSAVLLAVAAGLAMTLKQNPRNRRLTISTDNRYAKQ